MVDSAEAHVDLYTFAFAEKNNNFIFALLKKTLLICCNQLLDSYSFKSIKAGLDCGEIYSAEP